MKCHYRVTVCLAFRLSGFTVSAGNQPDFPSPPGTYSTSWVGNSFSRASNRWAQDFFIDATVQPDGTVNTWSHWDEGGKKFGVYKDGDVIGTHDVKANSLEVKDKAGHDWKLIVTYVDPHHQ